MDTEGERPGYVARKQNVAAAGPRCCAGVHSCTLFFKSVSNIRQSPFHTFKVPIFQRSDRGTPFAEEAICAEPPSLPFSSLRA